MELFHGISYDDFDCNGEDEWFVDDDDDDGDDVVLAAY